MANTILKLSPKETIGQDATNRQRQAAQPATSVWVGASAGTGKTKVLTDRILRLLLPSENSSGTQPHQILCITFTKAAAAEMALRLHKVVSQWVISSDKDLSKALEALLGHSPSDEQHKAARQLFPRIVDAPDGLNIMTIHSFCESILRRFPIEAGLPPSFEVMEEAQSKLLLEEARNQFLRKAIADKDGIMRQRLERLSIRVNDGRLLDLLNAVLAERRVLKKLFVHSTPENLLSQLLDALKLPKDVSEDSLADECISSIDAMAGQISDSLALFGNGNAKEQEIGIALSHFLSSSEDNSEIKVSTLKQTLYTKTGGPKKLGKKLAPQALELFSKVCEHILQYDEDKARFGMALASADLLIVSGEILEYYSALKTKHGSLDFDDQIEKTSDLLQGKLNNGNYANAFEWILFKLDNGIDHILVDEAQDTNPDQWSVIRALTDNFMSGEGARTNTQRSLFVVGDEKQSIYSFQRADPAIFEKMRHYFAQGMGEADLPWDNVQLNTSFRSVPAILEFVDHLFQDPADKKGLAYSGEEIAHHAWRAEEPGHVELWPLITEDEKETLEDWALPPLETEKENRTKPAATRLATKIAGIIRHWLDSKRTLGSTGLPVSAGDIIILLRKRSQLQTELVRALKAIDVPVEGLDRLILEDHIAVQDLIATARFALLPEDDYTLACLLKTPLIGWDEDQLMSLCFEKESARISLYEALQKRTDNGSREVLEWLTDLTSQTGSSTPYAFFARILAKTCPAETKGNGWSALHKRLGEEAIDPLESFLSHTQSWKNSKGRNGLQAFLQDMDTNKNVIKREMEESSGRVRIMTVHGAKGLQAPIIFLADTARSKQSSYNHNSSSNQIFWPAQTGLDIPFWAPGGKLKSDFSDEHKAQAQEKEAEEYKRLLYVAMTRAADELYITGHVRDEKRLDESCWYSSARNAMQRFQAKTLPDSAQILEEDETYTFSMFTDKNKKNPANQETKSSTQPLPAWIFENPKDEQGELAILQPSKAGEIIEEPAVLSPLSSFSQPKKDPRFHRGNIIHTALQFLPDLPKDKREKSLQSYLSQKHLELDKEEQENIAAEIITVLNHPVFAPVFGQNSRAEVSVTGIIGAKKISGQIDRLLIEENRIMIVDFKTNRPPPEHEKDIPEIYRNQLKAYKQVMAKIYPDKEILCGLLWTNIPKLMLVEV